MLTGLASSTVQKRKMVAILTRCVRVWCLLGGFLTLVKVISPHGAYIYRLPSNLESLPLFV